MEVVYLEEGEERLRNCQRCGNEICFLPDIVSSPKPYGRLTVLKWECTACDIEYFQTKRYFDIDTTEGAREYLRSEGMGVDKLVKEGLEFIEDLKNKHK